MKKNILLLFYIILIFPVFGQDANIEQVSSERLANYDISVKYTEKNHLLEGNLRLEWTNASSDTLSELMLHTYMNAFKNTKSTLMRESVEKIERDFGWISIISIEQDNGDDLSESWKYIQPDDSNEDDQTVISLRLKHKLMPGKKIVLDMNFQTQLPGLFMRTGFVDDYLFVGQWYPKMGVYESLPSDTTAYVWKCNQFHKNSEFYADFGNYKVDITLPAALKVGATGHLVDEKQYNNGTKTLYFKANDVTDFAWAASPDFVEESFKWEHVNVRILVDAQHRKQIKRYKDVILKCFPYFDEKIGNYPFSTFTIVSPPLKAVNSGGMEYPCLITTGTARRMPSGIRLLEQVTIHEFVHQYFMHLLASNEVDEPWLDEGFTTYFETIAMDEFYGSSSSIIDFYGIKVGDFQLMKQYYLGSPAPYIGAIGNKAYDLPRRSYFLNSYNKPALWLYTLNGLVGNAVMDKIIVEYFEKWKFKHPKSSDFIEIVNEIVTKDFGDKYGENLNWFFDQMLHSTGICDYRVMPVKINVVSDDIGTFEKNGKAYQIKGADKYDNPYEKIKSYFSPKTSLKSTIYKSEVVIHRTGEVIMPVEIFIHFDNGDVVSEVWNGVERLKKLIYKRKDKVKFVQIDPENKIAIDIDQINNSYVVKKNTAPSVKWTMKFLFWVQNAIQFFAMMV